MGSGLWDDASSHGIMHHEDGVHHEDACITPAAAHAAAGVMHGIRDMGIP